VDAPNETPRALLLHDGELADVRGLLGELGVEVFEARRPDGADLAQAWDVLVTTPRLVPPFEAGRGPGGRTRIAVLPEESRALSARLRRGDVDFVVRRPVHPDALRLLLLGALYRGPEKRRAPRVCVGAPVKVRVGLRRHPALLTDLSTDGCRLRTPLQLRRGQRLTLHLPPAVTGGRALALGGEVMRAAACGESGHDVAVALRVPRRAEARLAEALSRHAVGPGVLASAPAAPPRPAPRAARERRLDLRRAFARRVIALGEEAARVLIGSDLSAGGMRVEPGPELRVGERLRIALPVPNQRVPAVIAAEVVRDEGPRGYVLRFRALGGRERERLEKLFAELPALSRPAEASRGRGLFVSRIVERRRG
jgi:hypothetical protein